MKLEELKSIESIVKELLESDPRTRKDDGYLIYKVIEVRNPLLTGASFEFVMTHAKDYKISFESIRRARQKLQAKYPELKDEVTAAYRQEEQEVYQNYVLGD